jgi:hypothetical protein
MKVQHRTATSRNFSMLCAGKEITVRDGKGQKDRITLLPATADSEGVRIALNPVLTQGGRGEKLGAKGELRSQSGL